MAIDDDLSKIGSIAHTSIVGNWFNRGEMVACPCYYVECPIAVLCSLGLIGRLLEAAGLNPADPRWHFDVPL